MAQAIAAGTQSSDRDDLGPQTGHIGWLILCLAFAICLLPLAAGAQTNWSRPQAAAPDSGRTLDTVIIQLVDGSKIIGDLLEETATHIIVSTAALGILEIERTQIESLEYPHRSSTSGEIWREDPDYNSISLVPTSETLPRGSAYYRNYELFFNNIGIAITDYLNVSMLATFPVAGSVFPVMLGAKLRLVSRDSFPIGLAVGASTFLVEDEHLETLSAIASYGNRRASLSAVLNYGFADGDNEAFYLVGGDMQIGNGLKILAEYGINRNALLEETSEDFKGIINIGFRAFWRTTSFTLTGARPLTETTDGFFALPILVFSAHY